MKKKSQEEKPPVNELDVTVDEESEEEPEERKTGLRSNKPYIIMIHGGHGDNWEKIQKDDETCKRISAGELEVFHVDYGDDGQYRWRKGKSPLGFNSKFFHIRNPDFDDSKIPRMKGLKGKDWIDLNEKGKWQLDLIKYAIEFLQKHKRPTTKDNIAMVASQSSNMSHLYTVAKCDELLKYFIGNNQIVL